MAGYSIRQKLPSQAVVVDAIVDDGRVVAMRFDSFLRMFMCRARGRRATRSSGFRLIHFWIQMDSVFGSGFAFLLFIFFLKRPKCAGECHGKVVSGVKGCSSGSI